MSAPGLWGRIRRLVVRQVGCTRDELCERIPDSPEVIKSAAWAMCRAGVLDYCSFGKDYNRGEDADRNYAGPGYFVLAMASMVLPVERRTA
jgi:hypothetical protein